MFVITVFCSSLVINRHFNPLEAKNHKQLKAAEHEVVA